MNNSLRSEWVVNWRINHMVGLQNRLSLIDKALTEYCNKPGPDIVGPPWLFLQFLLIFCCPSHAAVKGKTFLLRLGQGTTKLNRIGFVSSSSHTGLDWSSPMCLETSTLVRPTVQLQSTEIKFNFADLKEKENIQTEICEWVCCIFLLVFVILFVCWFVNRISQNLKREH